jgi:hypothetical protein
MKIASKKFSREDSRTAGGILALFFDKMQKIRIEAKMIREMKK